MEGHSVRGGIWTVTNKNARRLGASMLWAIGIALAVLLWVRIGPAVLGIIVATAVAASWLVIGLNLWQTGSWKC